MTTGTDDSNFSVVFGIRTTTVHDEYMERLFSLMDKWSLVQEVGNTPPVDSFTILRILPERLLGGWRSRAVEVGNLMQGLYSEALDQVRTRRSNGVYRDSFMDRVLDGQEKNELSENELRFLGGVLMEGGSDTSSSLILTIIQAMTKYPAVQARYLYPPSLLILRRRLVLMTMRNRAHAEIDALTGHDRSPTWADFSRLPYINMIIKESHRWRPVSPLGVSHAVAQGWTCALLYCTDLGADLETYPDDDYNGFLIPKGSTIILNVWGMHHDRRRVEKEEHFWPERFENHPFLAPFYASGDWDKRDHYGYGAGRRICPGIHLAERNLFIGIAKLLWAFEFVEPPNIESDISPETGASQGFLHCPKDYGCAIRLRSPLKKETILREYREAEKMFRQYTR